MAQRPPGIEVHLVVHRDVKQLKRIVADIVELAHLIPEWQHYEAQPILDRIGRRMASLLKARD